MIGHSFGAYTALAAGGLDTPVEGLDRKFRDEGVRAVVSMCPPPTLRGLQKPCHYEEFSIPCLHLTGSEDHGPLQKNSEEDHKIPFDHSTSKEKYFVSLQDAHHFTFTDFPFFLRKRIVRKREHHQHICSAIVLFLNATLKEDTTARSILTSRKEEWQIKADQYLVYQG